MITLNGFNYPNEVAAEFMEAAEILNKEFGSPEPRLDYKTLMVLENSGKTAEQICANFRLAVMVGRELHREDDERALPNPVLK